MNNTTEQQVIDWFKETNMTSSSHLIWSHCQDVMGSVLAIMKSRPVEFWYLVMPLVIFACLNGRTMSVLTLIRQALHVSLNNLIPFEVIQLIIYLVPSSWSLAIPAFVHIPCMLICFWVGFFHKNNYLQDMRDFLKQWYLAALPWWINFVTGSLCNIFFPCQAFLDYVNQIQENVPYMDPYFQSMDYPIGNGYILMLADALKGNTSISYLNLGNQMYNGHAVEYLSKIIGVQNLTINHLVLSNNAIGNQGVVALANLISQPNCPLQHLHMANGWMTTTGSDAIVQALYTNTSLLSLDLSGNNMCNGKLLGAALKKHAILEHLILNDSCLGDVGVQDLLAAVKDNQALIKLDLGGNRMGVLGILAIVPILPQLTFLSIPNNWFGDAGAKLLADNLKDNTSLIFLSCYLCSLTSVGKQALVECLRVNTTMAWMIWDCFLEITNKGLIKERDALLQKNRNLFFNR